MRKLGCYSHKFHFWTIRCYFSYNVLRMALWLTLIFSLLLLVALSCEKSPDTCNAFWFLRLSNLHLTLSFNDISFAKLVDMLIHTIYVSCLSKGSTAPHMFFFLHLHILCCSAYTMEYLIFCLHDCSIPPLSIFFNLFDSFRFGTGAAL